MQLCNGPNLSLLDKKKFIYFFIECYSAERVFMPFKNATYFFLLPKHWKLHFHSNNTKKRGKVSFQLIHNLILFF